MFSEELVKSYKCYKFTLWFNRFALFLNCFVIVINLWTHHYWSIPISLVAIGLIDYFLRNVIPSIKNMLLQQARSEIFFLRNSWYEGWGSEGMPEFKQVAPILKRLN